MTLAIHRWSAPGLGSVNTYWIESGDDVIVIDGQRELSKARRVLAEIEEAGRRIVAVFLTHPHPDHFGGIGVFAPAGSGVPVYGSRQTRDSIAEDRFGLVKASREVVKDDFPAQVTLPTQLVEDGQTLEIAGVRIQARELGAGEAECMTALYLPDAQALFCADLIQHDMTAFLLEGRLHAWLAQLGSVIETFPEATTVYPGHGTPGTPDALVRRQVEYLRTFEASIAAEIVDGALSDGAARRVVTAMNARYPGFLPVAAIADLLERNVVAIAGELGATVPSAG